MNQFIQRLKESANTKFSVLTPSQISSVAVTLFVVLTLAIFVNTANFEKLRLQHSAQSQHPPEPPLELVSEGNIQGGNVLSESVPAPCYDFNGDGVVGEADAKIVMGYVFSEKGDGRYVDHYDLNHDSVIDIRDVLIVTAQNGRTCSSPPPSPVPPPTSTPIPSPLLYPYDLKVNLDMGCSGSFLPRTVIFSWKPAVRANWRLDVTDNNWQTSHSTNRFQITTDRIMSVWNTSSPMNDGFVPAFGRSYKWRVFNGMTMVPGPDFRTPTCPTPTPTPIQPPSPPPTPSPIPSPMPGTCMGPLKIMSVSLTGSGYQKYVVTYVDNLRNCNGIPVWVVIRTSGWDWQACTVSGNGCSTKHLLPNAGTYLILAVADLDKDGKWYEPGEYDKRTLTVKPNPPCVGNSCTP
ncbi:MAG: hypothetical protein ACD_13C00147G0001 [uncultured bacterium]|uniref:Dockerin domain-containing protein n=1 Tax=Candidatus Curtissbacteria bacterium RIFOXYA1_FULL_41_14 TaxID=1797737 RepID=A0A1F5HEU0_9BACT|nr:MAG: hypothetical protein ACD_13C00147G0001 [uncultured bacterium]KKR56156.1 MAG: Protein family CysZ [Candidatus Curtissbacteria bacterium GW2011_GWB1_40_28]KKR59959.1 MAG: Protein family CysZ [Microgenomates group bacterium GW2011_GWC1_40_35]KKR60022.1 MAG: Protein family CysZ [Candidatus Curtissbacteria bacterium GW2011_GWA2_40_31]KKS00692.1 MAG: Protein family CysZ [Candidatus Curtissbacteria bacterium GW2011_GWC2_41_21]OGD78794.1 MAG: hypothetical protein A2683_02225 [Candidatus Curtis